MEDLQRKKHERIRKRWEDLHCDFYLIESPMILGLSKNHWIGIIAGILTTGAFLPQVAQILKTRNTKSISLSMYVLSSVGVVVWIYYGFKINSPPIIIFNAINLAMMLIIMGSKLYWK